jgi:primosomal protein N'
MSSGASAPDSEGAPVASVVPLVPVWRLDRALSYAVPGPLIESVVPGALVRVPLAGRRVRGVVVGLARGSSEGLEEVAGVVFPAPVAPEPRLYEWIARRYVAPLGRAFSLAVPPRVRVRPVISPVSVRDVAARLPGAYDNADELLASLAHGRPGTWCVRTLPGEDRGRFIAALVRQVVNRERAALVAVPEVRYGSRVLDELAAAIDGLVRIDTAVSPQERSAGLAALASGHLAGAGGRAAVLAAVPALGLVVLDEEHHPTFKEDRAPRYDARMVARARARLQRCACVLISTTPSVETGHAAATAAIGSVAPQRPAERAARPHVELVDVPRDWALSRTLHRRMRDALRDGDRVALLVPARGYARSLWCAACRRSVRCPRCEAGLGFDRSARRVRCARCGWHRTAPDACPSCGATDWRLLGAGSERLEEQISAAFPRAKVVRVDTEVIESGTAGFADADVYVTTWIGTKAALRPEVSLVGVLNADALIRRPDYRAAERAHGALVELAEWAGPASAGGRLVIQTAEPGHHAVQAVVRADYGFFLTREIELRRELSYPPFSELIRIGATSRTVLDSAAHACRRAGATVLGPITTPSGALQILAKCGDAQGVADELRGVTAGAPPGSGLRIDVDPR